MMQGHRNCRAFSGQCQRNGVIGLSCVEAHPGGAVWSIRAAQPRYRYWSAASALLPLGEAEAARLHELITACAPG